MDETIIHRPPREQHLNPFAFPAETTVRFNLLIVAVVMLAVNVSLVALTAVESEAGDTLSASLALNIPDVSNENLTLAQALAAAGEVVRLAVERLVVFGISLALVFALAVGIYRGHPGRIRRSRKLRPLSPERDQKLMGELAALAGGAGVALPQVEIDERTGPADGQVFGYGGRYVMRLGGGMPLLLRKAPAMFRATVLHELAHIANGDVPRAYFSQSLWLALLALLIVPLGLTFCGLYASNAVNKLSGLVSGQSPDILGFITVATPAFVWNMLQLTGLLALYATIRGSLLRAREVYADWRSALWGSAAGLTAIFERGGSARAGGRFRLWRLHPTPAERLRLLRDPRRLFAIPGDVPLLVGALVGASASGVLLLSTLVTLGVSGAIQVMSFAVGQAGGLAAAITSLLLTLLAIVVGFALVFVPQLWLASAAAGSLGLEAQRDAVAALAMKERRGLGSTLGLIRPAALFAVGLETGLLIAPAGFFTAVTRLFGFEGSLVTAFVVIPGLSLLWTAGVAVLTWLWLIWASHTARRLLGAQTGPQPPEARRRFLTGWLAVILWLMLVPALAIQNTIWYAVSPTGHLFSVGDTLIGGIIGIGLAGGAAGLGWLLAELRRGGSITCPACKRKTRQRAAVGQSCEHCGAELAPWIIAQPRLS